MSTYIGVCFVCAIYCFCGVRDKQRQRRIFMASEMPVSRPRLEIHLKDRDSGSGRFFAEYMALFCSRVFFGCLIRLLQSTTTPATNLGFQICRFSA